jgi:hypothetical protein
MATLLPSPNLETVLMVERTIKKSHDYPTRMQLWRSLPSKVQYQTFKAILEYLEASSKIMFDEHGHIIWVAADNPKLRELLSKSVELR